jgi:antitoxin component YwqK of YwqJK toxin-antitoxin module
LQLYPGPVKNILALLFFLLSLIAPAQTDSIRFKGNWLKVYPYQYLDSYDRYGNGDEHCQLLIPMGNIPDGRYVQMRAPVIKWRWRYRENLNPKKLEPFPYAVFEVKNGKLNGPAIFVNKRGKIIEKGNYANNFKQGTWYWSPELKSYSTYKDGVLHGPELERQPDYNDRNDFNRSIYVEGVAIEFVTDRHYWYGLSRQHRVSEWKRLEKDSLKPDVEFSFQNWSDGSLMEEGFKDAEYNYMDSCRFYYRKNGALSSLFYFTVDGKSTGPFFKFWVANMRFKDKSEKDLIFDGIYSVTGYGTRGSRLSGDWLYNNSIYRVYGEGAQYYSNGQLQVKYLAANGEIIVDTLFHENGQPKYVVFTDSSRQEFVAQYFTKKGVMEREVRESWFPKPVEIANNVRYFKGLELWYYYDYRYEYTNHPSLAEIQNSGTDTLYTFLRSDGERLLEETYYLPASRTRVHVIDFDNGKGYVTEIRHQFDEDYRTAKVTIASVYDGHYKVISSFNASWNFDIAYPGDDLCFVDLDVPGYELPANFYLAELYQRNENGFVSWINYTDPFQQISHVETTYYFDDEPISGSLRLKTDARSKHVRGAKEKVKLGYCNDANSIDVFEFASTDRYGLSCGINEIWLLPDFFARIPRFDPEYDDRYRDDGSYTISTDTYNSALATGELVNGKLHGDWVIEDYYGDPMIAMSFSEGVPVGEFIFYSISRHKHSRYVQQRVAFENGLPARVTWFNYYSDTILFASYTGGLPAEAFYYRYFYGDYWDQRPILQSITSGQFENNELVKVSTTSFKDGKAREPVNFDCVNGYLHGRIDFANDSGWFDNGYYTGVTSAAAGGEKVNRTYSDNNLIYKKECVLGDTRLWRFSIDTANYRSFEYGSSVYEWFPWSRFPFTRNDTTAYSTEGDFINWYADGTPHSEGRLRVTQNQNQKLQTWKYHNPAGQVITTINYEVDYSAGPLFGDDEMPIYSKGHLTQYTNHLRLYDAEIISFLEQYDCMSDENYEIRHLFVLRDYLPDGTIIEMPTRYHRNFYDAGVVQSEGDLVNGLPHGLWKFYDAEGGLMAIGQFIKGMYHGTWFFGDLTGLNFLGAYCLNPDAVDLDTGLSELERSVDLTISTYDHGSLLNSVEISATRSTAVAE